jgi:hypothetical protein
MAPVPPNRALVPVRPKGGRPTGFSLEIANEICEWLREGKSLRSYCLQSDAPHLATVHRWLDANAWFREQYARAREAQADTLADEILDVARAATPQLAQVAAVQIQALKWIAGKLKPKVYGERVDSTHTLDASQSFIEVLREASERRRALSRDAG